MGQVDQGEGAFAHGFAVEIHRAEFGNNVVDSATGVYYPGTLTEVGYDPRLLRIQGS